MNELETPTKLLVEGNGGTVWSAGWNRTHSIPPDAWGRRAGGALVWTPPPQGDQICRQTVVLSGPLIVLTT